MLEKDHIAAADGLPGAVDARFVHAVIGTLHHDDAVVALGEGDVRRAGGHAGEHLHILGVDAFPLQRFQHHPAVCVVAHTAYHPNVCSQTGRRDSLVRALAAGGNDQSFAHDGLARAGTAVRLDGEIDITASDDCYPTHCSSLIHAHGNKKPEASLRISYFPSDAFCFN